MGDTDFRQHMTGHGYDPPEIIPDGKIHRFNTDGRKDKSAWYVFYADGPAGAFGNWATGEKQTWSGNGGKSLNSQQREALKENIRKAQQARRRERLELQKKAAERAAAIWESAKPANNDHGYLKKKNVFSHGLRVYKESLVVPMYDTDGELASLQFIDANGEKRFLKNGCKKGCVFIINSRGQGGGKMYFAEGYATAATIHKATGATVVVCFDSGNLGPAVDTIRIQQGKHLRPGKMVICGDNDRWTLNNPGLKAARRVAEKNRIKSITPQFRRDVSSRPTDFNDLCLLEGIDAVKNQLRGAAPPVPRPSGITAAELMKKVFPEPKWAVPNILPEGLNVLAGKPKHGKSIMALNVALAISTGGVALSFAGVERGVVIYLALEDTQRRLQARVRQMLYQDRAPGDLFFYTEWPQVGNGGLRALKEEIGNHCNVRLVVIDTWKLFRPASKGAVGKNLYDVDYESVTPIKKLAERKEVSVLMIHHLRKGDADDVFDTFSGSLGLTGAADGLLALKRVTGQADAELHITGRDLEAAEYGLRFHPDMLSWQVIGKADEVKSTNSRQILFDTLKKADAPLSPKDIAKLTGLKNHYIRNTLPILIKKGDVIKVERGKYRHSGMKQSTQYGGHKYKDIEDNEDN
jgi:phage/plasmid primase-like uncharacterized protein